MKKFNNSLVAEAITAFKNKINNLAEDCYNKHPKRLFTHSRPKTDA